LYLPYACSNVELFREKHQNTTFSSASL